MGDPAVAAACDETREQQAERLVRTYADMILRLSYTYLRTTQDAEDICQEVLLKAMGAPAFTSDEHERAWIIRVTANLCRDQLRRARVRATVPLEDAPEPVAPARPDDTAALRRHDSVLARVMQLPATQREAIYLHYYERMSIKQIAAATGRTEAAVAQNLTRGRAKLRTLLEGDLDELDL